MAITFQQGVEDGANAETRSMMKNKLRTDMVQILKYQFDVSGLSKTLYPQ